MNPLSNLIGKKFKQLNASELVQVVQNYCEQNRYEFDYELNCYTREDVIQYFESNFHALFILKDYFKFWTK